ncbi:MAG: methionyl-tRNA formyltransferase [Patescibacteria group bacterium]
MENLKKNKYNIAFFGSPEIATPLLNSLHSFPGFNVKFVVTQPDKKGNKNLITQSAVKTVAQKLNIPVYQFISLNDPICDKLCRDAQLDVCVLFAFGSIIPSSLLDIPHMGWLNVHPSLLPRFRGASPIQSAILAGDTKTGISLILMDDGVDTGPIIQQWDVSIDALETALSLTKKIAQSSATVIAQSAFHYLQNDKQPTAQPEEGHTMTRRLIKEDGKIDWNRPAQYIERMIRAYTPWPGTYTFVKNERIKILSATFAPSPQPNNQIGIFTYTSRGLHISCGKHTVLRITSLQRAGKKPQSANEFVRGFPDIINQQIS